MQQKLYLTLLLALFGAMAYIPRGSAQRSPYAPMPVSLPGLLPRFGEVDNNSPSVGQQAPSSSSGDNVGLRLGEGDRPSRPVPSRGNPQDRCPPQQVPCYDCIVSISRTGQITRYSNDQAGRRG